MRLANHVEAYNKATTAMNVLGPHFYQVLLPWQGKKVVKKDGWATKTFSEYFSTSKSFNYRENGIEVRVSCGGSRGIVLRVTATVNGDSRDVYYYAGNVSFNQFRPNPDQGVLEKVNEFKPGPIYNLAEIIEKDRILSEAEENFEKAKDDMGIFLHSR